MELVGRLELCCTGEKWRTIVGNRGDGGECDVVGFHFGTAFHFRPSFNFGTAFHFIILS